VQDARLLIDAPADGPTNMARDEALLDACAANPAVTLRFYQWSPATISLGYFQDYDDYLALDPPARNLSVVRRTTGGGAILHDLEVTYALVMPIDHPHVRDNPNNLYALAHRAIIAAVGGGLTMIRCHQLPCGESARRGPFFCFARRHALDVLRPDADAPSGYAKLAGSAQRRTRRAVLQHGSILLDSRYAQHPVATWSQIAGPIDFDEAVKRLIPAFGHSLSLTLSRDTWTAAEHAHTARWIEKYAGDDWNRRRLQPVLIRA
jgi:lipoate-protein ligase A